MKKKNTNATTMGTVKTLQKTLQEWFDYGDEPTGETEMWYEMILDCITQTEAGETIIGERPAGITLIWLTINFINSQFEKIEYETHSHRLEKLISLYVMVIRHMSQLTYREILALFPVEIYSEDGSRYFDGSDIYFNEEYNDFDSPSLDSLCLLTLCSSGIHFGDETEGTTAFDAEIGDGIMQFIMNNRHPVLLKFYTLYVCTSYSLVDSRL